MPLQRVQKTKLAAGLPLVAAVAFSVLLTVAGKQVGVGIAAALVVALVFSILHPLVPFALYFAALFFKDTSFDQALPVSLNQILAPAFFASVGLYWLRGKTLPLKFWLVPALSVVVIYFGARGIMGMNQESGLLYTRYLVIYFVMAIGLAMIMRTERTILALAWVIVVLTAIAAISGFVEAAQKDILGSFKGWGDGYRVKGTAANPVVFAWNMVYAFPFAFLLFAECAGRFSRMLAIGLGMLILGAALLTFNRQTYVVMVVIIGLCASLYAYRNRKLLLSVIAGFGGIVALTVLPMIIKRFLTLGNVSRDYSFLERRDSYLIASEMIKSRPVFGVGFGSFSKVWGQFIPADYSTYFAQYRGNTNPKFVDMSYLSLLAETGIVGLLLFAGILILIGVKAWKYRKLAVKAGDRFAQNLASALLVILSIIAMTSAIQDTFLYTRIWIFYGLAMLLDPTVLPLRNTNDSGNAGEADRLTEG